MEQRKARKAPQMGLSITPSSLPHKQPFYIFIDLLHWRVKTGNPVVLELWIPASAGMTDYSYI
jgi:hypothetical protein